MLPGISAFSSILGVTCFARVRYFICSWWHFLAARGDRFLCCPGPLCSSLLALAFFILSHCSIRPSRLPSLESAAFATQVATSFAIVGCRFPCHQLPFSLLLLATVFYASHGYRFLCSGLPLSPPLWLSISWPPGVAALIATCFELATAHFAARRSAAPRCRLLATWGHYLLCNQLTVSLHMAAASSAAPSRHFLCYLPHWSPPSLLLSPSPSSLPWPPLSASPGRHSLRSWPLLSSLLVTAFFCLVLRSCSPHFLPVVAFLAIRGYHLLCPWPPLPSLLSADTFFALCYHLASLGCLPSFLLSAPGSHPPLQLSVSAFFAACGCRFMCFPWSPPSPTLKKIKKQGDSRRTHNYFTSRHLN